MLYVNYYINNINNLLVYVENNNYYTYNLTNCRKFNNSGIFYTSKADNEIMKKKLIFFSNFSVSNLMNNKFSVLKNKLSIFFKQAFYENKGKLKIIGRGWKITKYFYQLTIKLGFSHMIFLNTSLLLKNEFKKKKYKYYTFFSVISADIDAFLNNIKLMRLPSIYTRKGIYKKKIIF